MEKERRFAAIGKKKSSIKTIGLDENNAIEKMLRENERHGSSNGLYTLGTFTNLVEPRSIFHSLSLYFCISLYSSIEERGSASQANFFFHSWRQAATLPLDTSAIEFFYTSGIP